MAQRHFITSERFIISYDDAAYKLNPYSGTNKVPGNESPDWDIVRLSDSVVIMAGFIGAGTRVDVTTGITTGTFLGLPRMILP